MRNTIIFLGLFQNFALSQYHDCPCTVYFEDQVFRRDDDEPIFTHPGNETCGFYKNIDEESDLEWLKCLKTTAGNFFWAIVNPSENNDLPDENVYTSGDTEIKRDGEKDTYIGSACPNNPAFFYNQRDGRDHDAPKRIYAEACQVDDTCQSCSDTFKINQTETEQKDFKKVCSGWQSAKDGKFIPFGNDDQCLYDVVEIEVMNNKSEGKFCSQQLFLGLNEFTFNFSKDYYEGKLVGGANSSTIKGRIVRDANSWEIYQEGKPEVYARTNSSEMNCPDKMTWQIICHCFADYDCFCGPQPSIEMNPPTIDKKDPRDCPDTCEHLFNATVDEKLKKVGNPTLPEYQGDHRYLRVNEYGQYEIRGRNDTLVARTASVSNVCPQDEEIWLFRNHLRDMSIGPSHNVTLYRDNSKFIPMSSLCLEDNWRSDEEHFGQKIDDCHLMKVHVKGSSVYLKKLEDTDRDQWSSYNIYQPDGSCNKDHIILKEIESTDFSQNVIPGYYKWGVVDGNGTLLAKTDDFAAQFPDQVKNWYEIQYAGNCTDHCVSYQNANWIARHSRLPECMDENLENYGERTCDSQEGEAPLSPEGVYIVDENIGEKIHFSLTFFLAIVLAAGILLLFIIQTYSKRVKKKFKNGFDDVDPEKSKSRLASVKDEDEYYQRFRDATNRIKQSDEAKHTLLQKYMPNVLQNYWSNSENHIGSGYYGKVFKSKVNLPQLTGEMLEKDVAIKISQRKCCEEEKCAVALLDDLNEASFLGLLEHKHVAHLIALTMEDSKHIAIIMPLYMVSLDKFLVDPSNNLNFLLALKFMWQSASGFKYLLQENILHHDIASRNILLDENLVPKIADFGLASTTDTEFSTYFETKKLDGKPLPMMNFAPERFDLKCSMKSEVYTFGFLMFEILTRGCPGHPLEERIQKPRNEGEIVMLKNYIQDENHSPKSSLFAVLRLQQDLEPVKKLLEIIENTWEYDYQIRPSFGTLENELRYNLYDFVGANCGKQPEINFAIKTHDSPFVTSNQSQYSTHVNLLYREWTMNKRKRLLTVNPGYSSSLSVASSSVETSVFITE